LLAVQFFIAITPSKIVNEISNSCILLSSCSMAGSSLIVFTFVDEASAFVGGLYQTILN
jgi:hypothetical protein